MSRRARPPHLPLRDGVAPSAVAVPQGRWMTVLECLSQRLPSVSPAIWAQRLQDGHVLNEAGHPLGPDSPCPPAGQRLYYYRHVAHEAPRAWDVRIVHQDSHLLVVDKPHGLPVIPSGRFVQHSLLVWLRRHLALNDLSPLHRIDRETAGLVAFSVQPEGRGAYQALFRDRQVYKRYTAIAACPPAELTWPHIRRTRLVPDPDYFFRMTEVSGTPNSDTRLNCLGPLQPDSPWALYELEPHTGQRHQLRVHMNALGLPLRGDLWYPHVLQGPEGAQGTEDGEDPANTDDASSEVLQLLAQTLALTDPLTGQAHRFVSTRRLSGQQSSA